MQFLPLTLVLATLPPSPSLQVRTDFPGGSAKVETIDAKGQRLALLPGGCKDAVGSAGGTARSRACDQVSR